MVDKYYNLSYQKKIIIIIFPTRSAAWALLGAHQVITPSIFLFYNTNPEQLHKTHSPTTLNGTRGTEPLLSRRIIYRKTPGTINSKNSLHQGLLDFVNK